MCQKLWYRSQKVPPPFAKSPYHRGKEKRPHVQMHRMCEIFRLRKEFGTSHGQTQRGNSQRRRRSTGKRVRLRPVWKNLWKLQILVLSRQESQRYLAMPNLPSWLQNASWSQIPHGTPYWYCCIPLWRVRESFYYSGQTYSSSKITAFKRATARVRMVRQRFLTRTQAGRTSTKSPHRRKTLQMQHVRPEIYGFKFSVTSSQASRWRNSPNSSRHYATDHYFSQWGTSCHRYNWRRRG